MRALLLDLDNTLVDDRAASRQAFGRFLAVHASLVGGASAESLLARWRSVSARHWQRFEAGEIGFVEQQRERVRDFLQQDMGDAQADAAFAPYLHAYEASWRLLPGAEEFLVATVGLPKLIVTNGDAVQQRAKVLHCGIASYVEAVLTPQDCGSWKPEAGIFKAALSMLGVAPVECLMIGDDPLLDIAPAAQLGMQTFLVDAANSACSLSAALALVGQGWER